MNFFEHQDAARRATTRLVALFALAVLLITVVLYVAICPIMAPHVQGLDALSSVDAHLRGATPPAALGGLLFWDPALFAAVSLGVFLLVGLGSLYKTLSLSDGGRAVAEALGATEVTSSHDDLRYAVLVNVVEEMAIASGVPVPGIYVMHGEEGINAFAAGWSPDDAAVAVTEGALDQLSRDELQAVIGHEFSHILNGDMRLNIRLMGVLHGILLLGLMGRMILHSMGGMGRRRSNSKGGGGAMLAILAAGVVFIVVGYVGWWMGQLIKAGISRQREFLADASAVQFTRNSAGLVGALTKIGDLAVGSAVLSSHAEEASHMFFGKVGVKQQWFQFMATHPPLLDRIERLDAGAAAGLTHTAAQQPGALGAAAGGGAVAGLAGAAAGLAGPAGGAVAGLAGAAGGATLGITPQQVVDQVGTIDRAHLELGAALLALLPSVVLQASREPLGAVSILYGLLLDQAAGVRGRQLSSLKERLAASEYAEVLRLAEPLGAMDRTLRLPLADLCLPGLRGLSDAQLRKAEGLMGVLAAADGHVDVFEFTLERLFRRRLGARLGRAVRPMQKFGSLRDVLPDIEVCLSVLAAEGHQDPAAAAAAWNRALAQLRGGAPAAGALPAWKLPDLEHSIGRLAGASPGIKSQFLAAAVGCVLDDGHLAIEEAELLRLFAYSLELPLPPLIEPRGG